MYSLKKSTIVPSDYSYNMNAVKKKIHGLVKF